MPFLFKTANDLYLITESRCYRSRYDIKAQMNTFHFGGKRKILRMLRVKSMQGHRIESIKFFNSNINLVTDFYTNINLLIFYYCVLDPFLLKPIRSDQSLSHVRLFATPWIAACQVSLSITNSWSSPKLMSKSGSRWVITEELGMLQSIRWQRIRHYWVTKTNMLVINNQKLKLNNTI